MPVAITVYFPDGSRYRFSWIGYEVAKKHFGDWLKDGLILSYRIRNGWVDWS